MVKYFFFHFSHQLTVLVSILDLPSLASWPPAQFLSTLNILDPRVRTQ